MQSAREVANELFVNVPGGALQRWRPLICPFEELIAAVPRESTVLDVGCGSGLYLGLLARSGRLRAGIGFDSSRAAIRRAEQMRLRLANPSLVAFQHRDVEAGWPEETFDVVSIIDVMHHVPPDAQRSVVETAATRIRPGGLLVYKDMVRQPYWRAGLNRLHDLVLARQWIHYVPLDQVESWMQAAGLDLIARSKRNMWWYGHEWLVGRRRPLGDTAEPSAP